MQTNKKLLAEYGKAGSADVGMRISLSLGNRKGKWDVQAILYKAGKITGSPGLCGIFLTGR